MKSGSVGPLCRAFESDCGPGAALCVECLRVVDCLLRLGQLSFAAIETRELEVQAAVLIAGETKSHLCNCFGDIAALRFHLTQKRMCARAETGKGGVLLPVFHRSEALVQVRPCIAIAMEIH